METKIQLSVGDWKMRNGKKAKIAFVRHGKEPLFVGYDTSDRGMAWNKWGEFKGGSFTEYPYDLISPWTSPIAPGHNPDQLTIEQVGDGWWLPEWDVLKTVTPSIRQQYIERWFRGMWCKTLTELGHLAVEDNYTYRTRLPRAELLALIAPKKRLIRVEELPPVCWVGCSDYCSLVTRRSGYKIGFPHSPDMSISELHCDHGEKWSSDLRTWNSFEVEDKQ